MPALRAVIAAFVSLIEDEPALYRFAYAQAGRAGRADLVAATEHEIAEALGRLMADRLAEAGRPIDGAMTWAYGVVGMVQLAAHWWSGHRTVSSADLVDQLTGLADGGLASAAAAAPELNRRTHDRARGAGGLRGRGHRHGRRRPPRTARAALAARFDPLAGHVVWTGRVGREARPAAAVVDHDAARQRAGRGHRADAWGNTRITGVGRPPFAVELLDGALSARLSRAA